MNKSIDKLLFNPIRLKIISTLMNVNQCDFNHLKKVTESTQGNLSIQLKKLKENDYINIEKSFKNNYPQTTCSITKNGKRKFKEFFETILTYRNKKIKS